MRSRRTVAATLLVIGLTTALAIISLDAGEVPAAVAIDTTTTAAGATTTPPTAAEPTTTTARAAAPLTDEGPPSVDLRAETFEDLRAVWDQIDAYWAWLNANPTDDPEVLGVIFHPEGIEYARQAEGYRAILNQGWRVLNGSPGEVMAFAHPDPHPDMGLGSISVGLVTADPIGAQVIDHQGSTVETLPGWERRQWIARLVRSSNGSWRVWSLDRA